MSGRCPFVWGDLEQVFHVLTIHPETDTGQHLPIFRWYASRLHVTRVVELGFLSGSSSVGFVAGLADGMREHGSPRFMRSIDLNYHGNAERLTELAKANGVEFVLDVGNSLKLPPSDCDLLMIDSLHTYEQLLAELTRWSPYCRCNILIHDTSNESFGDVDEYGCLPGLNKAIEDFLAKNEQWRISDVRANCGGLTILERAA